MKTPTKLSIILLGLLAVALTTGMNGGCGETRYSANYYYYPNWMADGRIIACKNEKEFVRKLWGEGLASNKYYMVAMNPDGSSEIKLFELSTGVSEITCSPTGELIAYIDTPDSKITISDYSGKSKTTLPNITAVNYLDWSPDAKKIAYNANNKLYLVNVDGTSTILITSEASGPISWRIGNTISYSNLYIINFDGTNNKYLVAGRYSQNYSTSEAVYQGSDGVYKIKMDGTSITKLFSDYDRASLKLSFDNSKIVGGDLDQSKIVGIWVTEISTGKSTKIR